MDKINKWKPMLLSNDEYNLEDLDYTNMFISIKRDGVRAETINGELKGRSLKTFKNPKLIEFFKHTLPTNVTFECEIYCDGIPCREMAGICNSKDKDIPKGTRLYIFGIVDLEKTFEERYNYLMGIKQDGVAPTDKVEFVQQIKCISAEAARFFFDDFLTKGFEGAVLMDGSKPYKPGRVTINEHIGFKLKPHKEDDLLILGVTERFLNTNESHKNELGQSFKRNTVDNKEPTGIAATFNCLMPDGKTETKVTITGTEADRRAIWDNKDKYIGMYAVVKSMDYGAKNKLRHPRLIDLKERCEK
jgi:hypothetical protein